MRVSFWKGWNGALEAIWDVLCDVPQRCQLDSGQKRLLDALRGACGRLMPDEEGLDKGPIRDFIRGMVLREPAGVIDRAKHIDPARAAPARPGQEVPVHASTRSVLVLLAYRFRLERLRVPIYRMIMDQVGFPDKHALASQNLRIS